MKPILSMDKISKIYPNGVVANNWVDFNLREGEIHALVGENGAGKSTLMKILFGLEQPTEGVITYNDQVLNLKSPMDAIKAGIGMVHQHFMLVPSLTIAENIVLGMEPKKGLFIDKAMAIKLTNELAKKYNFSINASDIVEDVSVGTKQKIEILKALYRGAKILILDEPTAVLTPQETSELFKELLLLKEKGHSIIFISHKLNEVKELCNRITIMRKGRSEGIFEVADVSKEEISNLMVGKTMDWDIAKGPLNRGEKLLEVNNISLINDLNKKVINDVSFSVSKGEILGIVAVEGNGQTEVVEGITGILKLDSGSVMLNGKQINKLSIKEIRKAGISHIPEDRMSMGISKEASIKENLMSIYLDDPRFLKKGIINDREIRKWSNEKILHYDIVTKSMDSKIGSLSGGNIQKVVVAREFSCNAQIIIANQPTRGIDIGAAKFIHKELVKLRDEGAGVILVSADLTEVMDLSDKLIVLYEGEIVAYFDEHAQVDESELGLYMLGIKKQSDDEIRGCLL